MEYAITKTTDITPLYKDDTCDKYDYRIAVSCGVISGLIDSFLVGSPGNSVLGKWTDTQVDKCVMAFAKMNGWKPRAGKENSVASAIGHLENKFRVNYDQRHGGDVDKLFKMSAKNHHMKSLAHSPSPIGLFFSILNQFTSTATFVSNGQIITVDTETYELQGGNFISKLFCGIANWIGHLMSDVAGSSGSVTRGSGIVMPFYELFGLCNFGSFNIDGNKQTLAQLATRAFENGYDARFGIAQAIPVTLCEVSIRLIWGIRQHFQYKKPLKECIPTLKHADLRVMLLCGHGTLCLFDGVDALIRSGGNPLQGFLHINMVGWCRLVTLVVKEICIRAGAAADIQEHIDAYKRIDEAVAVYLAELEKIDIEAFRRETKAYNEMTAILASSDGGEELRKNLYLILEKMEIRIPWETHDSFDSFVRDKNAVLRFQ